MPKASTNTSGTQSTLDAALGKIPSEFRRRIVGKYLELRAAFASGDYDTVGLRTGVFSETLLRFLQQQLTGTHIAFGTKIGNFAYECHKLEALPKGTGDDSQKLILPRALLFVYTMRNKRGIGHAAGDVDANAIDSATYMRVADWCICDLVRLYHSMSLEEAQALLDAISTRQLPEVWSVAGKRRVLEPSLSYKSQVLLLLHGEEAVGAPSEDLCSWVEHPRERDFRANVLRVLHKARLVEFDETDQMVTLSPTGAREVEDHILPSLRTGAATLSRP